MPFQEKHRSLICIAGLILSLYAYYVERMKLLNSEYNALCDISQQISCSAVFTSKYGTGLGFMDKIFDQKSLFNQPNSVYGIIFFLMQSTGVVMDDKTIANILFKLSFVSVFVCVYLAYVLLFVLNDICVVCMFTYILTYLLHYLNKTARRRYLEPFPEKKARKKSWFSRVGNAANRSQRNSETE